VALRQDGLLGNAASANDWQWVFANPLWQSIGSAVCAGLGAFVPRYWRGAPVMSPDTFLGVFLGGLFGFAFTWLILFIMRFLAMPPRLYHEQKDRADNLGQEAVTLRHRITELEDQLSESDPINQAFNERRLERYREGETFKEEGLARVIFWIAERSAWSRWQQAFSFARNGSKHDENSMLNLAMHMLQIEIEAGRLIVRGRRKGREKIEPISADFFCNIAALHLESDPVSLWRVYLIPRGTWIKGETAYIDEYDFLRTDFHRVEEIWPEYDIILDKNIESLLEGAKSKHGEPQ